MDIKAKKILFSTYWSSKGWIDRDHRSISKEDFDYAKSKGLMFDPVTISHDDCIKEILRLKNEVSKEKICKAFLSSLSTRRLDLRSSIASYYIANKLLPHQYMPVESGHSYKDGEISNASHTCLICRDTKYGVIGDEKYIDVDLNVLNFERLKWGGVRHGQILYTYFDLNCFVKEDVPEPTKADYLLLKEILDVIESSNVGDYPNALEERFKDVLPSNKNERQMLIEILACIGILEAKSKDRPLKGKSDWVYVSYWRGEDKYNKKIVDDYFGNYLNKI